MLKAQAGGNARLLVGVGAGLAIAMLLVLQAASIGQGPTEATSSAAAPSSTTSITTISGGSASGQSGGLHYVAFYDSGPCGANSTWGAHFTEWGVQLGNRTRTEPPNISVAQIPEDGSYSADSAFNMTKIVFLVPAGVYNFTLYPTALMRVGLANGAGTGGATGQVTVTNSDVTIYTGSVAVSMECSQ